MNNFEPVTDGTSEPKLQLALCDRYDDEIPKPTWLIDGERLCVECSDERWLDGHLE